MWHKSDGDAVRSDCCQPPLRRRNCDGSCSNHKATRTKSHFVSICCNSCCSCANGICCPVEDNLRSWRYRTARGDGGSRLTRITTSVAGSRTSRLVRVVRIVAVASRKNDTRLIRVVAGTSGENDA